MQLLSRRKRAVVATGLLLLVVVGAIEFRRPREPKFEGKTVRNWTKQLWGGTSAEQLEAAGAIRSIGSDAVPWLEGMLDARDSRLRTWFLEMCRKQSIVRYPYLDSAVDQKRLAIKALGIIGEPGRSAVPALKRLVFDWQNQSFDVNEAGRVANQYETNSTPYLVGDDKGPRLAYPNSIVTGQ